MLDRHIGIKIKGLTIYFTDPIFFVSAIFAYYYLSLKKTTFKINKTVVLLFLLMTVQFISVLRADTSLIPLLRMCVQYLTFILLIISGARSLSLSSLEKLFYYGLLYVPLSVILESIFYVAGNAVGHQWFGNFEDTTRFIGIAGDTAQASMLCLLITCIALYRISQPNISGKGAEWLIFFLSVLGNLLTGTRASLFCLPVVIMFFYFDRFRVRFNSRFVLGAGSAAMVMIFSYQLYDQLLLSLLRISSGDESVLLQRIIPMKQALAIAIENLWFGIGFGNSFMSLQAHSTPNEAIAMGFVGSFNQYIQSLLESGIPGLFLTVCFLLLLLFELRRRTSPDDPTGVSRGAYLWAVILVIIYQTETWISPGSRISFVFFALTASVIQHARATRLSAAYRRSMIQ